MPTTPDVHKLLDLTESAQRRRDRAEGALSQVIIGLKTDYGCDDEDIARKKLEKIRLRLAKISKERDAKASELWDKWGDKLDGEKG